MVDRTSGWLLPLNSLPSRTQTYLMSLLKVTNLDPRTKCVVDAAQIMCHRGIADELIKEINDLTSDLGEYFVLIDASGKIKVTTLSPDVKTYLHVLCR